MTKPMLAADWDETKVKFPVIAQPKIDGVRGCNLNGALTGRSLKTHGNAHITKLFTNNHVLGFDGELACENEVHPDLCRITSSAVSTRNGTPWVHWHVFDFVTHYTINKPYAERYGAMIDQLKIIENLYPHYRQAFSAIPCILCNTLEDLLDADSKYLERGYEGTIIRDPLGLYKQGRSTIREGGLLRIKRFTEEDAIVLAIEEGQTNNNVAITNALGKTERSSHQENMVPNGQIGNLSCRDIKSGATITVSPGKLTQKERMFYFNHPEQIVGQTIKYKHFLHGVKDKPRFPTFQAFRIDADRV